MAKIPLRAYDKEIENLIDSGQIDEAIAHCRHILQSFPKHVDTYRLLGKAYLEIQRYSDASDILQRVLSSIPDDFVSHVGMSIIREDEGNLEQAIWHMERAFEVQPANGAIQEELRRLYGRRDGLEPPRVRLTRGALARMYVKGDLYQQAIAELRTALAEDPQRIDLQVLLAKAYARAGMRVEAIERCNQLLKKLPYCMDALQIMGEALSGTERDDETRVYRNRLAALDPYISQTGPEAPAAERVPEGAITLEHLEYRVGGKGQPGAAGDQPAWAASLGIQIEEGGEETLPDWMSAGETEEDEQEAWSSAVARGTGMLPSENIPEIEPEASEGEEESVPDWIGSAAAQAEPTPEDQIPDWMKEAGWGPSTGAFQEGAETFIEDEGEAGDNTLLSADMPEWMKGMAPSEAETAGEETIGEESSPESELDWLQSPETNAPAELPDWLATAGAATSLEEESENEPTFASLEDEPSEEGKGGAAELPDWLRQYSTEQVETGENVEAEEIPEWLQEVSGPALDETESAGAGDETVPFWLSNVDEEIPTESDKSEAEMPGAETIPSWLSQLDKEVPAEEELSEEEAALEKTYPSWISKLEQTGPVEEEIPGAESLPDWLTGTPGVPLPEGDEGTGILEDALEAASYEPAESVGLPDWLQASPDKVEGEAEPEFGQPEEASSAVPEWLVEAEIQPESTETIDEQDVPAEEAEIPAWLLEEEPPIAEMGDTKPTAIQRRGEETPVETAPERQSIETPDLSDEDAAFAWLESLAVKQGASEALLLSEEERQETPPEWVQELVESDQGTSEPGTEVGEASVEETIISEELEEMGSETEVPGWLLDAQAIEEEPLEIQEVGPASLEEEPLEAAAPDVPESEREPAELPDWMQETILTSPEAPPEEGAEEAVEPGEIPDWLLEEQPEISQADLSAQEGDEAEGELVWLESRAVEPVDSESLLSSEGDLPIPEVPVIPAEELEPSFYDSQQADWFEEATIETAETSQPEERDAVQETEAELPTAEETPQAAAPGEGDLSDMEAAFAWLESLAVKQGASEALLLSEEERQENPPEWVQELVESDQGTSEPGTEVGEASVEETIISEELEEMGSETEVPGWLLDAQAIEEEPLEIQEVGPASLEEEPLEAAAPEELRISEETEVEAGAESPAEANIPSWLLEEEQEVPLYEGDTKPVRRAPAAESSELQIPTDESGEAAQSDEAEASLAPEEPQTALPIEEDTAEAGFAWLEGLAVKQGANEALLLKPEERRELPPNWLESEVDVPSIELPSEEQSQSETETGEGESIATEMTTAVPELPDWLQELTGEETGGSEENIPKAPAWLVEEAPTAQPEDAHVPEERPAEEVSQEESGEETVPELPDWLSDLESSDKLDWTPPPVSEKMVRQLDLNLASLAELERLPGVGFRMAQAIVNHRETHGPFQQIQDLFGVPGFSQTTLEFIQDRVYVTEQPEQEKAVQEPAPRSAEEVRAIALAPIEGEAPAELVEARDALLAGNIEKAAGKYDLLIKARKNLPQVISDLDSALQRSPDEVLLWQALGDAYMRSDNLQEALNAYNRAEELLR